MRNWIGAALIFVCIGGLARLAALQKADLPRSMIALTTATVPRGVHVVVRELEAFGVAPIDLSLTDAVPNTPFPPSALSVTPELEISRVDVLSAPYPGYRVTVRNLSPKAIATFGVRGRGAGDLSMSMIRAGTHRRPAMNPGESYTFDVNLTSGGRGESGPWSPTLLDVIEIDSVLWHDGSVAGSLHNAAAWMIPVDAGRRLQLVRAVEVLRSALTASTPDAMLAILGNGFEALPSDDTTRLPAARQSMAETRAMILSDFRHFEGAARAHDAAAVSQWIESTIGRYESWLKRLSPL